MNAALKLLSYAAPPQPRGRNSLLPGIQNPLLVEPHNYEANSKPEIKNHTKFPAYQNPTMENVEQLKEEIRYPTALLKAFGASVLLFVFSFIALVSCYFASQVIGYQISTFGLAFGAIGIAFTLLRGQELSEQKRLSE